LFFIKLAVSPSLFPNIAFLTFEMPPETLLAPSTERYIPPLLVSLVH